MSIKAFGESLVLVFTLVIGVVTGSVERTVGFLLTGYALLAFIVVYRDYRDKQ